MKTKINLNNLKTREKWNYYLNHLKIVITTDEGIIILNEPLRRKWLKHSFIENKVREKFKTILALTKLRDSDEKRSE